MKIRPFVDFTDRELQQLLAQYAVEGGTRKVDAILDEIRERTNGSDTTLAITEDFRLLVKQSKHGSEKVKVFG